MDLDGLSVLAGEALQLSLLLAAPSLISAALVGLVAGVLQGATQIQDPSLGFVPKLLAVALALALFGPVMGEQLVGFTGELWARLPELSR